MRGKEVKYEKVRNYSRHEGGINLYLTKILGSKFSEYRKIWDSATSRQIVTGFPLFVLFETQSVCNYHCAICYKFYDALRKQMAYSDTMSMDMFKQILDECSSEGCPSMSFNCTNEPLMDPFIFERISIASRKGIVDLMMNTNGFLLDKEASKKLIDSGLTRLLISLDAVTPETYKLIRSPHYERVKSNIDKFLNLRDKMGSKLPILRLSYVVTKLNEDEQVAFMEEWKDKADQITFQRYIPPIKNRYFMGLYPTVRDKMHFSCSQPFERLIVRGNGDVYPCCNQCLSLPVGNVREKSLSDIWEGLEMSEYRRIVTEEDWESNPFCRICIRCR